jgi:predicted GNAT superfamily acetyltransferase
MPTIEIRRLRTPADFKVVEDLQLAIWNFSEREITPITELVVIANNGGAVFGAFDGRRMIGFLFGQAGLRDGRPVLCSRMLGVLPDYQSHGVGASLKWAQADAALAEGITVMTWTFDPLQAKNAYFNIARLGAVTRTYEVDRYGSFSDSPFNDGVTTDRFIVEWYLECDRFDAARGGELQGVIEDPMALPCVLKDEAGLPVPTGEADGGAPVRVEIPGSFPEKLLRYQWRESTRSVLQTRLESGWWVDGYGLVTSKTACYRLSPEIPWGLPEEIL